MRHIMLQQNKHDCGQRYHPQKRISKIGTGGQIGSPVARIDESNGYQQTRTNKFENIRCSEYRAIGFIVDMSECLKHNLNVFKYTDYKNIKFFFKQR